jgi:hypothetical protein
MFIIYAFSITDFFYNASAYFYFCTFLSYFTEHMYRLASEPGANLGQYIARYSFRRILVVPVYLAALNN